MIKVFGKNGVHLQDISDELIESKEVINEIRKLGSFKYDVFFDKKEIHIRLLGKRMNLTFGCYKSTIIKCLNNACESFCIHKENKSIINFDKHIDVPVSFIDEIHLIGILYVEKIKNLTKEEMNQKIIYSHKSRDVKKDYNHIIKLDRKSKMPFIEKNTNKNNIDTWWMKPKKDFIFHSIKSTPSYIELMGCFMKDTHTIYMCNDNIDKTISGLSSYDKWFLHYSENFKELILLHEIGHSIFQYVGTTPIEPIINETRANYYSSLMTNGLYDDKIEFLTTFQPFVYKFPYLSFDFMIKKCDKSKKIEIIYNDYFKMVGVLYEK